MIRICTLRYLDPWFRKDRTGRNKVGYVTKVDTVIYPVRRPYVERPLAKLRKRSLSMFEVSYPAEQELLVETFFSQNVLNPMLMQLGMFHLTQANFAFFRNPVRLPKLFPIDDEEHRRRWIQLLLNIRRGDLFQVLDESSLISRSIAKVERGSWSHSASYAGNGNVIEAITSGVVERTVNSYNARHYRIGIYRHPQMTDEGSLRMIEFARSKVGNKYSWRQASLLGLKKIFGIRHRRHGEISPNEINALNEFELICIV
jgi:hypothetical protein